MSAVEGLRLARTFKAARELLTAEGAWTQGALARDAHGFVVPYDAPNATCWCLQGALHRVTESYDEWSNAFYTLANELRVVPAWNDHRDRIQADVLQILDNLIARHSA